MCEAVQPLCSQCAASVQPQWGGHLHERILLFLELGLQPLSLSVQRLGGLDVALDLQFGHPRLQACMPLAEIGPGPDDSCQMIQIR